MLNSARRQRRTQRFCGINETHDSGRAALRVHKLSLAGVLADVGSSSIHVSAELNGLTSMNHQKENDHKSGVAHIGVAWSL